MQIEKLNRHIARAVLRVKDHRPGSSEVTDTEILFTVRPGWSKIAPYELALPGGKIDPVDFVEVLTASQLADPNYEPTTEQLEAATLKAVEREIQEELGLIAIGLIFVDVSTNTAGWTTYTYATELQEKPQVLVQPDSAGTLWVSQERLLTQEVPMLDGHLTIVRTVVKILNSKPKEEQ